MLEAVHICLKVTLYSVATCSSTRRGIVLVGLNTIFIIQQGFLLKASNYEHTPIIYTFRNLPVTAVRSYTQCIKLYMQLSQAFRMLSALDLSVDPTHKLVGVPFSTPGAISEM